MTLTMVLPMVLVSVSGCGTQEDPVPPEEGYRQAMRNFVQDLSARARNADPDFIVVPQNGQELVTDTGEADGIVQAGYLSAIDATGREDLFYGYDGDDLATPDEARDHMLGLCNLCEQHDVQVLSIDYCRTREYVDASYEASHALGFISFAADRRTLDDIPGYPERPYGENVDDITDIGDARNFLYLLNTENYAADQFIEAVAATDYDLVVIDLFDNDGIAWTASQIERIGRKANGGRRIVLCYLSIGEAEDYRYYWKPGWKAGTPEWLEGENPDWEGNYRVRYWYADWQDIIFGNDASYLARILDAGFDGVYLDLIDAFEYFE